MISAKESPATSLEREKPLPASGLWTVALARPIAGSRQVRNDLCRVLSMKASFRVVCCEWRREVNTDCVVEADPSIGWLSERPADVDNSNAH